MADVVRRDPRRDPVHPPAQGTPSRTVQIAVGAAVSLVVRFLASVIAGYIEAKRDSGVREPHPVTGHAVITGVAAQPLAPVTVVRAAAVGAGTSLAKAAAKEAAKDALDKRVVRPVKRKAITWGIAGFIALTAWVVVLTLFVVWMDLW